jgi:hypothetical protein
MYGREDVARHVRAGGRGSPCTGGRTWLAERRFREAVVMNRGATLKNKNPVEMHRIEIEIPKSGSRSRIRGYFEDTINGRTKRGAREGILSVHHRQHKHHRWGYENERDERKSRLDG